MWRVTVLGLIITTILTACAPQAPVAAPSGETGSPASPREPGRLKVLNLALSSFIDGFSIAASSTTNGGALAYIEIHSAPLVTADKTSSRPVGRLAIEPPSLENGGLVITPDGRMIATYRLRPDATWHDGAPVTSHDLALTYALAKNPSFPIIDSGPTNLMDSVATPDDHTFVINFKQPYYLADSLGLRAFWPLPAHILQADFERLDPAAFVNLPYWTTEYVHAGPFKLTQYIPGNEIVFDAYDSYFLGRPKVDRIVAKQFGDEVAAYASVLAGAVDLGVDNTLRAEQIFDLKSTWDANSGGSVYIGTGNIRFASVQFDANVPDFQPALQDKRVRQALYTSIDRAAYADVAIIGHPERTADAILPDDDPLYSYVKGGMDRYLYDPNRAGAMLDEAGWRRGPDGVRVNSAGARFTLLIRGDAQTGPVFADMMKKVGVAGSEYVVPPQLQRDRAARSQFPGIELSSRGSRDSILTRLECSEIPTLQNTFSGNNRGKWCNRQYEDLVTKYRTSLREDQRGVAIRQIQELVADEVPYMLLAVGISAPFARRGVTAFKDDYAGGADSGRIYGTYSRNAHEWDLQP